MIPIMQRALQKIKFVLTKPLPIENRLINVNYMDPDQSKQNIGPVLDVNCWSH